MEGGTMANVRRVTIKCENAIRALARINGIIRSYEEARDDAGSGREHAFWQRKTNEMRPRQRSAQQALERCMRTGVDIGRPEE
jgi:hypothetical protein